ncbi:DNA methyltransferase [Paraburkholderia sp. RL17-383-BIF-A]|uniref:hypothetical protein n=1 Tax=Paraburkholderia sp. RL17-383-BIF-A TaxID=3031631 RepID=UPI0038BDB31F
MTAKRWIDACHFGDCRLLMARMAADGVQAHTVVTSPPYYGLRSYLPEDAPNRQHELGLERTPREYVDRMVDVFRHVCNLLVEDSTVWLRQLVVRIKAQCGKNGGGQAVSMTVAAVTCPACGAPMRRIKGSRGYFWGCSAFRDGCRATLRDVDGVAVQAHG